MNTQPKPPSGEIDQHACPDWCSGRHLPDLTPAELALSHLGRKAMLERNQDRFEKDRVPRKVGKTARKALMSSSKGTAAAFRSRPRPHREHPD